MPNNNNISYQRGRQPHKRSKAKEVKRFRGSIAEKPIDLIYLVPPKLLPKKEVLEDRAALLVLATFFLPLLQRALVPPMLEMPEQDNTNQGQRKPGSVSLTSSNSASASEELQLAVSSNLVSVLSFFLQVSRSVDARFSRAAGLLPVALAEDASVLVPQQTEGVAPFRFYDTEKGLFISDREALEKLRLDPNYNPGDNFFQLYLEAFTNIASHNEVFEVAMEWLRRSDQPNFKLIDTVVGLHTKFLSTKSLILKACTQYVNALKSFKNQEAKAIRKKAMQNKINFSEQPDEWFEVLFTEAEAYKYFSQRKINKALTAFQRLIQVYGQSSNIFKDGIYRDIYYSIGVIRFEQGDYNGASTYFSAISALETLETFPNRVIFALEQKRVAEAIAYSFFEIGDYEHALTHLEAIDKRFPSEENSRKLAICREALEEDDQANTLELIKNIARHREEEPEKAFEYASQVLTYYLDHADQELSSEAYEACFHVFFYGDRVLGLEKDYKLSIIWLERGEHPSSKINFNSISIMLLFYRYTLPLKENIRVLENYINLLNRKHSNHPGIDKFIAKEKQDLSLLRMMGKLSKGGYKLFSASMLTINYSGVVQNFNRAKEYALEALSLVDEYEGELKRELKEFGVNIPCLVNVHHLKDVLYSAYMNVCATNEDDQEIERFYKEHPAFDFSLEVILKQLEVKKVKFVSIKNMGKVFYRLGYHKKAKTLFDKLPAIQETAEVCFLQGLNLMALDDQTAAMKAYGKASGLDTEKYVALSEEYPLHQILPDYQSMTPWLPKGSSSYQYLLLRDFQLVMAGSFENHQNLKVLEDILAGILQSKGYSIHYYFDVFSPDTNFDRIRRAYEARDQLPEGVGRRTIEAVYRAYLMREENNESELAIARRNADLLKKAMQSLEKGSLEKAAFFVDQMDVEVIPEADIVSIIGFYTYMAFIKLMLSEHREPNHEMGLEFARRVLGIFTNNAEYNTFNKLYYSSLGIDLMKRSLKPGDIEASKVFASNAILLLEMANTLNQSSESKELPGHFEVMIADAKVIKGDYLGAVRIIQSFLPDKARSEIAREILEKANANKINIYGRVTRELTSLVAEFYIEEENWEQGLVFLEKIPEGERAVKDLAYMARAIAKLGLDKERVYKITEKLSAISGCEEALDPVSLYYIKYAEAAAGDKERFEETASLDLPLKLYLERVRLKQNLEKDASSVLEKLLIALSMSAGQSLVITAALALTAYYSLTKRKKKAQKKEVQDSSSPGSGNALLASFLENSRELLDKYRSDKAPGVDYVHMYLYKVQPNYSFNIDNKMYSITVKEFFNMLIDSFKKKKFAISDVSESEMDFRIKLNYSSHMYITEEDILSRIVRLSEKKAGDLKKLEAGEEREKQEQLEAEWEAVSSNARLALEMAENKERLHDEKRRERSLQRKEIEVLLEQAKTLAASGYSDYEEIAHLDLSSWMAEIYRFFCVNNGEMAEKVGKAYQEHKDKELLQEQDRQEKLRQIESLPTLIKYSQALNSAEVDGFKEAASQDSNNSSEEARRFFYANDGEVADRVNEAYQKYIIRGEEELSSDAEGSSSRSSDGKERADNEGSEKKPKRKRKSKAQKALEELEKKREARYTKPFGKKTSGQTLAEKNIDETKDVVGILRNMRQAMMRLLKIQENIKTYNSVSDKMNLSISRKAITYNLFRLFQSFIDYKQIVAGSRIPNACELPFVQQNIMSLVRNLMAKEAFASNESLFDSAALIKIILDCFKDMPAQIDGLLNCVSNLSQRQFIKSVAEAFSNRVDGISESLKGACSNDGAGCILPRPLSDEERRESYTRQSAKTCLQIIHEELQQFSKAFKTVDKLAVADDSINLHISRLDACKHSIIIIGRYYKLLNDKRNGKAPNCLDVEKKEARRLLSHLSPECKTTLMSCWCVANRLRHDSDAKAFDVEYTGVYTDDIIPLSELLSFRVTLEGRAREEVASLFEEENKYPEYVPSSSRRPSGYSSRFMSGSSSFEGAGARQRAYGI